MKKSLKLLSLVLVFIFLFVTVVGCGGTTSTDNTQKSNGTQTETKDTEKKPEEEEVVEETYDFGGRSVRFAAWWDQEPKEGVTESGDLYVAKLRDMEEKYNFKFEWINIPEGELLETLTASNLAGDPFTDFIYIKDSWFLPRVVSGEIYPVSDLKAFDFSEEKWNPIIMEFGEVNGKKYALYTGKLEIRGLLFWNKTIFEREGLPNLYELQNNYQWTWDKFLEVAQKATKDLDGDGTIDQWGVTGGQMEFQLIASNDADPIILKDGKWTYNLTDPKCLEALQFYQDLAQVHKVYAIPPEGAAWDWHIQAFKDGYIAMMAYHSWTLGTFQTSMEDDYGVVLFPMGPRAKEYYSELEQFVFQVMPSAVHKPEELAIVYDEMTDPIPGIDQEEAWRDGQLNNLRDEESLVALSMIYEKNLQRVNRWFSFPDVVDIGWGLFDSILRGVKAPTVAVEEVAQQAQSFIDDTMGYNK